MQIKSPPALKHFHFLKSVKCFHSFALIQNHVELCYPTWCWCSLPALCFSVYGNHLWSIVINTKISKALSQIRTVLLVNYCIYYHNIKIKERKVKWLLMEGIWNDLRLSVYRCLISYHNGNIKIETTSL